ncbi:C6 zinc finger domain-containing protein [Didymella exigua CBS 183.55]|uniref:C6 zinc finger domain-containing protein n=1 Tax=Didymella exigua CBS 183.55 TaxID=1150837 RepID=A0A6A5RKR9_9PLEO|nr:C6 zinc finger domain-containing protein [Didymella exigua CBS 183.55]KAF1927574.1 C6 zinc finger domain-containing protein [Didymella exigua CBS 183.55]
MTTPRRKACVECRQQKIRCDVEQHKVPHDPCGRCKKMGLECRILPTSTRNLRQTKAEMRRELEELRWSMRHNQPPGSATDSNYPHSNASPNMDLDRDQSAYSDPSGQTDGSYSLSPGPESRPPTRKGSASNGTIPRMLEGYVLDPKRIDDCFMLFFTQYHPLFPILDASLGPNDYYDLSPFLFWTIIVIGSRRYADDPNILDKSSQLITPLAFSSIALRSSPMPVIQGLLLLCTWRLPTNSMYKDMTHLMCGSAVHLATQIGLHISGVGQDFARMPVKKDLEQKVFRARLWLCCVVVSIRTSCAEGIPPLAESFFDCDERDREDINPYLPTDLQFLHKVYITLLRAIVAMGKTNLQSIKCDVRVLRSVISIFDSQLLSLAPSAPSELDTMQLNCARIHVMAFHFFAHPMNPDVDGLSRFYSHCISTINTATAMAQTVNFASVSQSFVDRTICLAGFSILRLVRSPLAQHLDLTAGEQAYFQAVEFLKNVSMQSGDVEIRTALIMNELWNSNKVFRRRDGRIESLGLRLRTRLSMSVTYDMFWYWREEFNQMQNPYNGDDAINAPNETTQPGTSRKQISFQSFGPQLILHEAFVQHQSQDPKIPVSASAPTSVLTAQQPLTKFDPSLINPQLQVDPSAGMSFDTWDGSDYSVPPMLDQFPDYDWAAGFGFSNSDLPSVPLGPLGGPLMPQNVGNMGYTFG